MKNKKVLKKRKQPFKVMLECSNAPDAGQRMIKALKILIVDNI
jgi:hypothetical protein